MFYIKQLNDGDCGITCLKILLANVKKDENYLFLPTKENKKYYSFLELTKISKQYGLELVGKKYDDFISFDEINAFPCIASGNINGVKHSFVVLKRKKNKVYVLDPFYGKKWKTIEQINKVWDKHILEVINKENVINAPQLFTNLIGKNKIVVTYALQILSNLFLIVSLYFVKDNSNSLLFSSISIFLYILFSFLFRIHTCSCLSSINNVLLNRLKIIPKNKEKFTEHLSGFKSNFFLSRISVISDLLSIIFLSFIFLYNNKFNGILLIITILVATISILIFGKIKEIKTKEIDSLEKRSKVTDLEDFKQNIEIINDKVNKFVIKEFCFTLLEYAFIVLGIILIGLFFKNISLGLVVFEFIFCSQLLKCWKSLMSFEQKEEKLTRSKNLLSQHYYDEKY